MFYHYSQNNSGGSFSYDYRSGISHHVVIEAADAEEADYRAVRIGIYFDGCLNGFDCDCCGDRWSSAAGYSWKQDGSESPEVYGQPIEKVKTGGWRDFMDYEGFVHYRDGRKVGFAHKSGPGLEVLTEEAA